MTNRLKHTALAVLVTFTTTFIAAPASAALIGTEAAVQHTQDRSELKQFFDRADIAEALQARGVSPEMAKARVDSMTEAEAQKLAQHIESAPAGAGVLGIIFTVFIVLLITDILGFTKVFPFTRSLR